MTLTRTRKHHRTAPRATAAFLISALLLAVTLTGCGAPAPTTSVTDTDPSPAPSTSAVPTTTTKPSPSPTPDPALRNPLTGEYTLDPDRVGVRPAAVMFSNIAEALPQVGVGQADLIYETVVEAGITRMMALFADPATLPEMGSIRSTRHPYVDLALGHDAVLVHFG